jgi:hypothetical protein
MRKRAHCSEWRGAPNSLRSEVMIAPPPSAPIAISTQSLWTFVSGPHESMMDNPWSHGMRDTANWNHLYSFQC